MAKSRKPKPEPIIRNFWKWFGAHPVIPIVAGVLVSLDTPGNVTVKSVAFVILGGWLWVDLLIYFTAQNWRTWVKITTSICSMGAIVAVVYLGVSWFVAADLGAKREEVNSGLAIDLLTPELAVMPPRILFSIKNNSPIPITKHQSWCIINRFQQARGGLIGPVNVTSGWDNNLIGPHGEGQTDICSLSWYKLNQGDPIVCVDITMKIDYVIAGQPDSIETKSLRFVASQLTGPHWYEELPESKGNYCDGTAVHH